MSRKLLVHIPQLTEAQRDKIRLEAEKQGLETCFQDQQDRALEASAEAEVIFGQDAELVRRAEKLKWICTPSAGADHFMTSGLFRSPEVVLTNSAGAYGVTIAEHTVMVTLEVLRRQQDYTRIVADKAWRRDLPIRSIRGSRVLILGTGDIGREVALRLRAFSPERIVGINRSGRNPGDLFDAVDTLPNLDRWIPDSDLVILALPGTAETIHVLDHRRLAALPDKTLIVNVGRGSAIDQEALREQLQAGRLFAALDVFETEPLPQQDPLWTCPNLLLTPHVAGNMTLPYTLEKIVDFFLENLAAYGAGKPLKRQVDFAKGY